MLKIVVLGLGLDPTRDLDPKYSEIFFICYVYLHFYYGYFLSFGILVKFQIFRNIFWLFG